MNTIEEIEGKLNLIRGSILRIEEILRCNFSSVDNVRLQEQREDLWYREWIWARALKLEKLYNNVDI